MVNVVVTGSSGFIGGHLVAYLKAEGHDVVEITSKFGDIADQATWRKIPKASVVMHLAGKVFVPDSWAEPEAFIKCNVMGTIGALGYCALHKAKLIYLSSYLYGAPAQLPIRENAPLVTNSPYALSKKLAEDACEFYARSFGVNTTILRPFNVYGPGQAQKFLIPSIVQQVHTEAAIRVMDLEPKRDYVYVTDLVRALVMAINDRNGFSVCNIGSGMSHSVADVIGIIQHISGSDLPVYSESTRRKGEVMDTIADIGEAKRLLNWTPRFDLREGLADMLKNNGSI